jgi:DAK2 domain fusion protein YloV
MTAQALVARDLRAAMFAYRDALRLHQDFVNSLNVYPVPDGDTGTNMALTLEAVAAELDGLGEGAAMGEVCKAVAHGSLMGARGNSGVILSQLLRGIAERLGPSAEAGPVDVADALVTASDLARKAVVRPVEGTILTVADAAGEGARTRGADGSLVSALDAARRAAAAALARTPEMLEVLARAGVVDAGGAGYLLLLDAFLLVVDGRPIPEPPPARAAGRDVGSTASPSAAEGAGWAPGDDEGMSGLRYEVMYLLETADDAIADFKEVWAGIGDSIVVVGGDGLYNCHIHTDEIGAAIEAALDVGRPRRIRVTDLEGQVEEERWVREGAISPDAGPGEPTGPPRVTDVVAIVTGDGIGRIFRSLGVHRLVRGGQSMNPSTAEILDSVEASTSENVVVLPNNKNIRPVAEQVDPLTERSVRVVPTGSIVEGFAALLDYDPAAGLEENVQAMTASARRVVPAEVTQAVRDAHTAVGAVHEGDWIGLSRDRVMSVGPTAVAATCELLARLLGEGTELVTLIEGEGATAADTRRITEWLNDEHPDVAAEVHHGGQPLYPYLLGIE